MRPLPPLLEPRLRGIGSPGRIITEVRAETAADLRQVSGGSGGAAGAPIGWKDADNWGAVASQLQILDDGSLTLKPTTSGPVGPTTHDSFFRDRATSGAGRVAYIDPLTSVLDPNNVIRWASAVQLQFSGTQINTIYPQLQAWLTPQFDATKPVSVQTWICQVYRVDRVSGVDSGDQIDLVPVASATTVVGSSAAGFVVFTFHDPLSPKQGGAAGVEKLFAPLSFLYLVLIQGLDGQRNPAQNIGWGFDSGNSVFTLGSVPNQIVYQAARIVPSTIPHDLLNQPQPAAPGHVTINYSTNIHALQLIPATYSLTPVTLTFKTGKPISLSPTPTVPPECVLRGGVPNGCTLQGQVALDPAGAFENFSDGQTVDKLATPLATQAVYDMNVTLQANSTQDAAPILTTLGMRAMASVDLGDECTVQSWSEQIDPVFHTAAIAEAMFRVEHDGVRDFRDKITLLLSQNPPSNLYFRVWFGDRQLSKSSWLHLDDFLIDDQEDQGDAVVITGVSVMQFLRTSLPVLSSDVSGYPTTDSSNAGSWTTVGAPTTNPLSGALADLSSASVLTVPNDTTYVQSVVSPSSAQFVVNLASLGAPPLNVGVVIQLRAAVVGAGASVNVRAELLNGSTLRATLPATAVTTQDIGPGSYVPLQYFLTAAEVVAITNAGGWGSLSLRFTASSTAGTNPQIRVSWARVVQLGNRQALQYPSALVPTATIQNVLSDLLNNQGALDRRYNGVGFTDAASNPITVAKTISVQTSSATDLNRLLTELHALLWIGGHALLTSQGKIKSTRLYEVTTGLDPIVGDITASYAMKQGKLAAVFPFNEVQPLQITPGWRHRVPVFAVPWGWNGQTYAGESQVAGQGVTFFPAALIDPEPRLNQTIALWVNNSGLARGLAIRHVLAFGLGLAMWRFRATQHYPELELGDLVAIQTDQFITFDPIATLAVAGKQWAMGIIVGRHDAEGREFTAWVQSYSGLRLLGGATSLPPVNPISTLTAPTIIGVQAYADEAGNTWINLGCQNAGSVRVAASTSATPSDATTRAATPTPLDPNGNLQGFTLGIALAVGQTVFVKVFAYQDAGGNGVESLKSAQTQYLFPARKRGHGFDDALYTVQALDQTGGTIVQPGVQTDSTRGLILTKGHVAGVGQQAGSVSYATSYQNTPVSTLRGGILYEPRAGQWSGTFSATLPQYEDFAALNPSAAGFTIRARLRQKGTPTARTAEFPTGSGSNVTTVGGTEVSGALASAPSSNDHYIAFYKVHMKAIVNNKGQQISMTLAVDGDPTNSGTWTQLGTVVYSYTPVQGVATTFDVTDSLEVVQSGFNTSGKLRMRMVSLTGPYDNTDVFIHGSSTTTDSQAGVTYTTATDSFATKTPDAADSIMWDSKVVT